MRAKLWATMAAGLLCISTAGGGWAQSSAVRIEEDWELHVTQPDPLLDAPQVTTRMTPFGAARDVQLEVDLNHGRFPKFSMGGLQIRACMEEECLDEMRLLEDKKLKADSEVVRWTQVVQRVDGGYVFGVASGTSVSWGDFGGPQTYIQLAEQDVGANLDAYQSQDSLNNSGCSFASNRVALLQLMKVRVYSALGEVNEILVNGDAL